MAWSAPAPPADAFILNYSAQDSNDDSEIALDGSKTRITLTGLLPSRRYTVTLVTMHGNVTSKPVIGSVTTGIKTNECDSQEYFLYSMSEGVKCVYLMSENIYIFLFYQLILHIFTN